MTDATTHHIVLDLPGCEAVTVHRSSYGASGGASLGIDRYLPPEPGAAARPAVLFLNGYPDPGFRKVMGSAYKDMDATVSWARVMAAAGFVGITYENADPRADARRVLDFVVANAGELGVDAGRIGLWACSGHAPTALWLMSTPEPPIRCAALLYGYLMDLPGHDEVATAAGQFGFTPGPPALADLGRIPTLLLRAGRDVMPGLLPSLDRFVAASRAEGLPITLLSYPEGEHAFDLGDDSAESLATLRSVVEFFEGQLQT